MKDLPYLTHYTHEKIVEKGGGKSITEQCDTSVMSILKKGNIKAGGFAITEKMSDEEMLATEDKTRAADFDMLDAIEQKNQIIERKKEIARLKKEAKEAEAKREAEEIAEFKAAKSKKDAEKKADA